MLIVTIPATEIFNNAENVFINIKETKLQLEHSLISLSKWEAEYEKPFLTKDPKTIEETLFYIKCMTINQVDPIVYKAIPQSVIEEVTKYINKKMTATVINDNYIGPNGLSTKTTSKNTIITSEEIYYDMIALQIPVQFEKWHLSRLLTLIKVCSIRNEPPKKMGKQATMRQNSALNAARRAKHRSKG